MSLADVLRPGAPPADTSANGRRLVQLRAIVGLELRKTLLRPRSILALLVAFLPMVPLLIRQLVPNIEPSSAAATAHGYGVIFQTLFLRMLIFFGCAAIFGYLVRGEMLERSLHFYLLTPLERPLLLAGKYLAGLLLAVGVFWASLAAQLALAFLASKTENGAEYLFSGPGLGQAFAYFGVTFLACVGYGAVFLVLGLVAKNPMIPMAALLGWESLNLFLPPTLQKVSVIHYLQALCPVPIDRGPFALPADPPSTFGAIFGLVALAAIVLWWGGRRMKQIEINYSGD
jgi:hypothetical protein